MQSNGKEVSFVVIPSTSLLGCCSFNHSSLCGWLHSRQVSHESTSIGSGSIHIPKGTCSGTNIERMLDKTSGDIERSLDRESDTVSNSLGNHLLKRQLLVLIKILPNWWAVVNWMASSILSVKFDFLSHPAAVELSVWDYRHDLGSMLFSKASTQRVIIQARNSRMFWAYNKLGLCIAKLFLM